MPSFRIKDLPSFISPYGAAQYSFVLNWFRETFDALEREISFKTKATVLVNTFEELEKEQIKASHNMDLVAIGPLKKDSLDVGFGGDLLMGDDKEEYMEWLNGKEERSVVYVSFGSLAVLPLRQREEISKALVEAKRPFLWVARGEREGIAVGGEDGKLVGWCSQVEVLASRAVGCFVTHCGWNSTLESLVCGVPTVGLPQWTDQPTNARLAEAVWGVGVTAEVSGDGIVEAAELRRCIDRAMVPDGEIRRNAQDWSTLAQVALKEGGSSDRNLGAFMESLYQDHRSPIPLRL